MIWIALAAAQDPVDLPMDMERFRPNVDNLGFITTASATSLERLQTSFGLHLNISDDPVVLLRDGRRVVGPEPTLYNGLIDRRARADLQLAVGIRSRFSLGMTVPVTVWQRGFEPSRPAPATGYQVPLSGGIGDVRLTGKWVAHPQGEGLVGVALATTVSTPTGSRRSFLGEGTFMIAPKLVVEVSDRPVVSGDYRVRGAVNLGAELKPTDTFRGVAIGSGITWSGAVGMQPVSGLELAVEMNGRVAGALPVQQPMELLPHLRVMPLDILYITAGFGLGLRPGLGVPDRRFYVGVALTPRFDPLGLDKDGDGIPNRYDACILSAEDLDGYEDSDGCPEEDNDGDGLLDDVDLCPDLPEDLDGVADHDGCPDLDDDGDRILEPMDLCPLVPEDWDGYRDLDGCPDADNDGDGILDLVDQCPMAPEIRNGYQDDDGCPDSKRYADIDGDGLVDERDVCPSKPEDFDGFEDSDGCPEPDNDGDGLLDPVDHCPNEAETPNGYQDGDGCPDEQPMVMVQAARLEIRDRVFFERDRAVIRGVSHPLLDEVARVVLMIPDLQTLRVEGHTDHIGGSYYNLRLSQARARSVKQYLVGRGVPASHLEAVGFGETHPIADNHTEAGRAANRRVEFVIVRSK